MPATVGHQTSPRADMSAEQAVWRTVPWTWWVGAGGNKLGVDLGGSGICKTQSQHGEAVHDSEPVQVQHAPSRTYQIYAIKIVGLDLSCPIGTKA